MAIYELKMDISLVKAMPDVTLYVTNDECF